MTTPERLFTILPQHQVDKAFYDRVRAARPQFKLVDKFVVPPFSGRGFTVKQGQSFRFIDVEGPQIADVILYNANNPREAFHLARTSSFEAWWIKLYSRIWSNIPWFRPMATCIEDTVVTLPPGSDYHHHTLGAHCSPEHQEVRSGRTGLNNCHLNLLQAIEPFGLTEDNLHDNFNAFQKERQDVKDGLRRMAGSDAKKGDALAFYADIDLLVGVSVCPGGDGALGGVHAERVTVRPIGIEVYETGIPPKASPKWTDWRPTWKGKWEPAKR
jgi:hypothetical protein